MPRTEDDGDELSVVGLQRQQEVAYALDPRLELLGLTTSGQYAGYYGRVADVPCRAAGQRVTRVPRYGDDAATLVVSYQLVVDALEGHAVQVLRVVHLDAAQVESHYCGVVADEFQHVAASQFGTVVSVGAIPRHAVHRVVLVAHHVALLLQRLQSLGQSVTDCRFLFVLRAARHQRR